MIHVRFVSATWCVCRQINLLDNVVNLLEKYASNLEQVVQRRTEQLSNEKMKAENILNSMLPRYAESHMMT